ncbi:OmpH family outer membrane protein [Thalassospira indica]|uniref:OmpH family outer membrane protein n=1 Tax=Thalassospira indica TaxID=1891279 RepID=A0ABM6Y1N3_9PROT|nr:OmpH family outer membrane protein [Thalassospira indica]AXO15100.1 OmpH family outer membrane protein [Thalassospira indica]OAZ13148.1 membrane protein [Thalassospira profundimaris]
MKMIKSLRNLLVLCALIGGSAYTSVAHAQEPNPDHIASVMIVDVSGIMREASAMQDARKQIRERQVAFQKEIETREQGLREEEKQLAQQRTLLAADVFQGKQKEFQQKVADFQKFAQARSRVLDQALAEAQSKFSQALNEIIGSIAEERGANLVLHRGQAVLFATSMDATKEVFDRANAEVPTIKVEFKEGS